jgi:hypothetical protein
MKASYARLTSAMTSLFLVTSLPGYRNMLPDCCVIDRKIGCSFDALNGTERILAPVASKIAFEIAEVTTAAVGSPASHGFLVGRSINSMTISGSSGNVRIGWLAQSRLITLGDWTIRLIDHIRSMQRAP